VVDTPTRKSARHRAAGGGPQRSGRIARYLLCGLLLAPVLIAGSLYLARESGPGASPPVPGKVTALQTAGACGSAIGGSCAEQPIHVSLARVPREPAAARTRRSAGHPAPTVSASSGHAGSTATPSATSPAGAPPGPGQQGAPAEQVLALIDQARSAAGLPALTITAGLVRSASAHNLRMADGCGLSHQCPGEPPIGTRETAAGVDWTAAGENIGEGGPVADTTTAIAQMLVTLTQDMLNEQPPDDGHRMNILSTSFTHIGIAVYRDSSGTVWLTQDFSN